jgi:hypothetical protein
LHIFTINAAEEGSSVRPYDVVITVGGASSADRKSMVSRKPAAPSLFALPTDRNVMGTPVARPRVYYW